MKKLALCLFVGLSSIFANGQCDSTFILCSQQDIIDFSNTYGTCTEIAELRIRQVDSCKITDLSPLNFIERITRRLSISSGDFTSLQGFENLKYVEKLIFQLASSDIIEFPHLDSIITLNHEYNTRGEDLSVYKNVKYIENLNSSGDGAFTGLESLESYDVLKIWIVRHLFNFKIADILKPNTRRLGGLAFSKNVFINLEGLEQLDSIGDLSLRDMQVTNIDPLLSLDQISDFFYSNDEFLVNFQQGFENVKSLSTLWVRGTTNIDSLAQIFPNLQKIEHRIYLGENPNLVSVNLLSEFPPLIEKDLRPTDIPLRIQRNEKLNICSNNFICQAVDSIEFPSIIIQDNGTYCHRDSLLNGNCLTVSTGQSKYQQLEISPNPTFDFIYLKESVKGNCVIMDIQGRVHYQNKINGRTIDVSNLPSGNYILRIVTESAALQAVIVRQ